VTGLGAGFFPEPSPQPPTSALTPTFDVASIKVNKADSNLVNLNLLPGGRFVATNVSLQVLISVAYGDPSPAAAESRGDFDRHD
jgi:hypothetical protein